MSKEHKASIDGDQWAQCVREHGWLWDAATGSIARAPVTLILAHGAGAPMDSAFMSDMAARLAGHGVNVLRFEFPYMVQRRADGGKRPPNPAPKLLECWREVYAVVRRHVAGKLAIGGKSMGGRMASIVADELGADGLVCLGYPFYAVGKPEKRLNDVETVYAMTVHKSQGSEFTHTALILPDALNPVLTKELIYTGITRAKRWFSLIEPRSGVFEEAVRRKVKRLSGLMLELDAAEEKTD